jgi:hypothetical protein
MFHVEPLTEIDEKSKDKDSETDKAQDDHDGSQGLFELIVRVRR